MAIPTPAGTDERLRRATRECALAVVAVEQALRASTLPRSEVAGTRTALVYASASAYAAANWAFLHAENATPVYFPYTAPSAVPGEVTIQFNIIGPYLSFLSGANAGLEALWQAATLLATNQCDRALLLGIETFVECAELFTAGRWLLGRPLVETALCLVLERRATLAEVAYYTGRSRDILAIIDTLLANHATTTIALCLPTVRDGHRLAQRLQTFWPHIPSLVVSDRAGTCLASTPLIGLLLALAAAQQEQVLLISRWGNAWSILRWPLIEANS
jgi:hypothetical protein